ncbi:hypothetical protein BGX26_008608, partial [Mortierella sp. AD094]
MKDIKDLDDDDDDEEEDESDLVDRPKGGKDSEQSSFLSSFLTSIYSGNRPTNTGIGSAVNDFIDRLIHLKVYTPPPPSSDGCKHKTTFTSSELVQSVSTRLRVELKKMYKNGSCDLYKMLITRKKKSLLGSDVNVTIREEVSAIENYLALNKIGPNSRRVIPMTGSKQPFMSFTECQLAEFFFSHGGILRARVQQLVGTVCTSIKDAEVYIGGAEPGVLIKHFLVDIDPKLHTS